MEVLRYHKLCSHEKQYNRKRTTCDICGKLVNALSIERHRKIHADGEDRLKDRAQCDICFKWFISTQAMKNHKKISHSELKLECNECNKIFRTMLALNRHIAGMHRERPHKCTYCPSTFISACLLKVSYEKLI